jgi:outer membrane receptor for ferrienterochelin and colicin
MLYRSVFLFLIGALGAGAGACLPPPTTRAGTDHSASVVTAEEIARSGARTAWEAIRFTVRHIHLQQTNGTAQRIARRGRSSIVLRDEMRVFIDDLPIGDLRVLQQIAAGDIALIRVLSGLEATTRYGTNSGDGVILISTRAGPE